MTTLPYAFDGIWANPAMPLSGQTVNGAPFTIPRGARSIAIHCPALAGGGAPDSVKIQCLQPVSSIEVTTETWTDAYVFNLADGTTIQLDGIPESQVTTIPTSALGSAVIRFVATADQSGAATTIPVFMNFAGG